MEIKCKHDITWHNMTWHDITDITCVLGNQTFLLVNKLLCGPVDLNIGQSVPMCLMLDPWITYQRFLANDFWFFVTLFPFNHLAILPWLLLTIHAAFHLKMISVILTSLWYVVRFPNPNLSDMHHLHLVWKFYSCLTSESSRCSPLFHRLGFIIPELRSKTNPQFIQY